MISIVLCSHSTFCTASKLFKVLTHISPLSLPWRGCWKLGQWDSALVCQCGFCLRAGGIDTWYTDTSFDVVTDDDRWAATRRCNVEVLELDVLANSVRVGAAGERRNGTTIFS